MADNEAGGGTTMEELMVRMGLDLNSLRTDIRQFKAMASGMVSDSERAGIEAASTFVAKMRAKLRAETARIRQAAFEGMLPDDAAMQRSSQAIKRFNGRILQQMRKLQEVGKLDDGSVAILGGSLKSLPRRTGRPNWSNDALNAARRNYDQSMLEARRYETSVPTPDPARVRENARKAAREFNTALLNEISRLQQAGKLDDVTFRRLSQSMKSIPSSLHQPSKKAEPWSNAALSQARSAYNREMLNNRLYETNVANPDPNKIRDSARNAARTFNAALFAEMNRLHNAGKLDELTFRKLSQAMKVVPPALRQKVVKDPTDPNNAEMFLKGMSSYLRRRKAEINMAQAAGTMTPEEARAEATRVAKAYNEQLMNELQRRRDRSKGQLSDDTVARFGESLAKVPRPLRAPKPPRPQLLSQEFRDATSTYEGEMAKIRSAFMNKALKPREAQQKAIEVARAFNRALSAEISRALSSGNNNLAGKLSRGFKPTGRKAGAEFGAGLKSGMDGQTGSILNTVRGIFSLQILSMIGSFVSGAINLLKGIAAGIDSIAQRAGQIQRLRTAFIALNNSIGESASTMLNELRKGARGTASDMQLMLRANMALTARLPVTAQSLGEAVMLARRLGNATGMGTEEAFSRIIRGTGKLEIELLDELGLLNGVKRALKEYERQTGKNADNLSQAAKVQLFWNATIAEAREKVASMGPDIMTAADRVDQLKAAFENFKSEVAVVIADTPALIDILDEIGLASADSADKVGDLADRLGAVLDTTLELGKQAGNSPIARFFGATRAIGQYTPSGLILRGVQAATPWATNTANADDLYSRSYTQRQEVRRIRNMESIPDLEALRVSMVQASASAYDGSTTFKDETGEWIWTGTGYIRKDQAIRAGRSITPAAAPTGLEALSHDERNWRLRAIDERLAQLRAKGNNRPSNAADPEKVKQGALNKVESVRDEMQRALDEITFTTLDELSHQIERAEREARQAFKALGQELPKDMVEGFERRRGVIDAQVQMVSFQRRYDEITRIPDKTSRTRALESDMELLRAQQETVKEGSKAWYEYNAILDATEDSLNQAALEHLNQQLQQQRTLLSELAAKRDTLEEGSSIREEYNNQIRITNELINNTIVLIGEQNTREKVTHAQKMARMRREKKERQQRTIQIATEIKEVADSMVDFMAQVGWMGESSAESFKALSQMGVGIVSAASGDIVGGITGILGGLGSLFGKKPETERERAIRENSNRLKELSQKLDKALRVSDVTNAAEALSAGARQGMFGSLGLLGLINSKEAKARLSAFLAQFDTTIEELNKIAEEYGIQIMTDSGKIIWPALSQLSEALGYIIEDLAKFGESLNEQRSARELLDNVNDIKETPQRTIQREMELLNKFSPQLATQYGLLNQDPSSQEGRKAIKEAIVRLLNDIFTGVLNPTLLGSFENLDDLISIITNVEGAFDELNDSLSDFQSGLENAPEGFKYALEKFNATIAEQTLGVNPNALARREVGTSAASTTNVRFGDVIIQESDNGTDTYRRLYEQMMSAARSQGPNAVNAVLQLPKPK